MTIKECIDIVDNAKPNQYGIKEKVMWLSFVDETIINDVLKTHEGYDGRYDNFEGYTENKLSVPLIVPSPYDRLYPQYIKMMIDSENGETARYNNSSALYNTYLNEYKKYYNKTHMPINATQKIPSPVSININSALSDAQIEYIKRQLYYMLSQDFDEVVSRDKLYDIVTSFVSNNLEMLKTKLAMSYKGETSVLPDNAKTGDVYRIAETIYEKDTIYIPCDGVGIGFGDTYSVDEYTTRVDIGRYSLAEQICSACDSAGKISIVSDMFADNVLYTAEVVDYNVSEGYLDFKNESEAFIAVLLTSERARYIIPDELIERNRLSEYKIANYFKGDCVVYENGTWKKLGNDEIANIYILLNKLMIEIDNKNDSFAETIDSLNEYKVDTDLANVDNEVFKAKAEEAGVGGDAGLAGEPLTKTKLKIYPFSGMSGYYDENVYTDGFVTTDYVPDGTETYIFEPSRAIAPYFISAFFEPVDYSGSGVTDGIAYTIYCSKALEGVSEYGTLTILK